MDPQFSATREDLYHVQMDVKHVQAVQTNHADRLLRLEKRQADDAALRSVWGNGSPFPSVLGGTPQQGPIQNPPDVFDDFDEQSHNLLGNLQLEAEEEPVRRGASRANSVRFDVSALQGSSWAQSSRNSGDFGPVRPNSEFGSHPMTERSLSHKSDGRHSSAGHSVHSTHSVPSGRASSLGLDTNFLVGGQDDESPTDVLLPPPGLFILGSVPSIIRCWLTTNFSHNALLYSVVCSGSQRSVLDYSLVKEMGLLDQIQKHPTGRCSIRLPLYLPEAVITQPCSRSNSPAPQLPTLTADFEISRLSHHSTPDRQKAIRVFLGSDTLRAHNADILFSQNLMTLYGDDRNKVSVPFVRPEDENIFKNLCTTIVPPEKNELKATAPSFTPTESKSPRVKATPASATSASATNNDRIEKAKSSDPNQRATAPAENSISPVTATSTSDTTSLNQTSNTKPAGSNGSISGSEKSHNAENNPRGSATPEDKGVAEQPRRESSGGIWGSWRQGGVTGSGENGETTSGYQRPTRGGRNMKVLKPSKSAIPATAPARPSSAARTGAAYTPAGAQPSRESRRKSQTGGAENAALRWDSKKATDEQRGHKSLAAIPRSSNPIGGASAFAWMNPDKSKAPAAAE